MLLNSTPRFLHLTVDWTVVSPPSIFPASPDDFILLAQCRQLMVKNKPFSSGFHKRKIVLGSMDKE